VLVKRTRLQDCDLVQECLWFGRNRLKWLGQRLGRLAVECRKSGNCQLLEAHKQLQGAGLDLHNAVKPKPA